MAIFLAVILLFVVVIFGAASIMQSHAAAKQAEAVIETAKAAQMATFANVMVIVLLVVVVLALLGLTVYLVARGPRSAPRRRARVYPETPLQIKIGHDGLPRLPLFMTAEERQLLEEELAVWDMMSEEDEEAWQ